MVNYSDHTKFLFKNNFIGDVDGINTTGEVEGQPVSQVDGNYVITYSFLRSQSDIINTVYYESSDEEVIKFIDPADNQQNPDDYQQNIEDAQRKIFLPVDLLNASTMWFQDVANIKFTESAIGTSDLDNSGSIDNPNEYLTGHIAIGQLDNSYSNFNTGAFPFISPDTSAVSIQLNPELFPNNPDLKHGDIFINSQHEFWDGEFSLGNESLEGNQRFKVLLEETLHSLGADIKPFSTTTETPTYLDNQKYTVAAYQNDYAIGMGSILLGGDYSVAPHTLQMMDIAALQEIYGRNYQKLSGNTEFTLSVMNPSFSSDPDDAFLYTIWDGGGIDTLDASQSSASAEIDLRQGRFSSIGDKFGGLTEIDKDSDVDTSLTPSDSGYDPDPGNVAIAFYSIIENATGTAQNDYLIGNAWNNVLDGGEGDDWLFGDGVVYDNNAGFLGWEAESGSVVYDSNLSGNDIFIGGAGTDRIFGGAGTDTLKYSTGIVTQREQTGVTINTLSASGTVTDEYGDTDSYSSVENFILTVGQDTVYGHGSSINNVIHGNLGHDKYIASSGILEIKDGELIVWDSFGNSRDNLNGFEEISAGKVVSTSMYNTTFTTLLAAGSSFIDVDYRDATGAMTFNINNNAMQVTGTFIDHNYLNGDTVNIVGNNGNNTYTINGYTKNIYAGTGDDTVTIIQGSANISANYAGGHDTYNIAGDSLKIIRLGDNIVQSDINPSITVNLPPFGTTGFQAIVQIGTGSITINQFLRSYDPVILALSDGSIFVIQRTGSNIFDVEGTFNPVGIPQTGGFFSGYSPAEAGYGTWGDDTWTMSSLGSTYRGFGGIDVITGGLGDDIIYGGSGLDTLNGEAGNDTIYGGDDTDTINGGTGTNTIYGGLGGDIFHVGLGTDEITGGEGADIYIIDATPSGSGSLTITDFDITEDRIDLTGLSDPLNFDFINWTVFGLDSAFTVTNSQYSVTLTDVDWLDLTASNFVFGSGGPYVYDLPVLPINVVTGDSSSNTIDEWNSDFALVIEGLGGDDDITGTYQNDYIYGGNGEDTIFSGDGNDVIYGNDGSDYLNGNYGDDFYVFNTDTDIGLDTVEEWDGDDVLVFEGSLTTSDIYMYQNGDDLVLEGVYNTQSQYWVVQITNAFWSELPYDPKVEYIVVQDVVYDLEDVYNTGVWTPYVAGDNNAAPNAFDDLITIDRGGVVTGNVFNDNGNGADYDPEGTDLDVDPYTVSGAYGIFSLSEDGSFTITGTQNYIGTNVFAYTLLDLEGNESYADVVLSSVVTNEAPTASAMDANLVLQAGDALNFVSNFTDPDGDTITYSATLQDGSALPSYIVVDPATGALTGTLPATSQATIGVRVIAADWMSQTTYDFDLSVNNVIAGTTALDYLHGDAGVDTITGDDGNDRLYGYEGDDILDGQAGSDYIYGHEGNDTLTGDTGADSIYGLEGDDTIYGGADNDVLRGDDTNSVSGFVDAGDDIIYGDAGNDNISGGDGDDELHGGTENDVINGDDGADDLYGDTGDDFLYGGAGGDFIDGGDGNDKLYGEAGTDVLIGGAGTDTLYGGDDNDILIGGTGTDFLYGQGGADTFKLDLTSIDRLSDFDASEGDTIDIADLLIGYDSATDDINDFVTLVYRNAARTDIRVNDDGLGTDLPYVGIVFSDLTGETVNTLVASGTLIVE
ncbi:MAG: hypothetical protein COA74_11720 [Gammaproteobacteria bacterium]|nr:MAG: hypothetical protein COA74_11720 [Gammaproteobacteria bacterium]